MLCLNTCRILTLGLVTLNATLHATSPRVSSNFDEQWQFHLGEVPGAENPSMSSGDWQVLDLPHDWSIEQNFSPTNASGTGFLPGGIGWYRKTFVLPEESRGQRFAIEFDGVYRNSDVWINGVHLGQRPYGYIGFQYDLTPHLQFGNHTNLLAVRVERENVADSRWYPGTGIYRHVRLTQTDPIHIAPWGVFVTTPVITDEFGDVATSVEVVNNSEAAAQLRIVTRVEDAAGKRLSEAEDRAQVLAGESHTFTTWQKVNSVERWTLENPALYTLKTRVWSGKVMVDELSTQFGFRSFHFNPDTGFFLNGTNILLKGLCMHHDAGVVGAAVPRDVLERRLRQVKELGANAIRCSHNPMSPELYSLCDELGLLVMDEAFDEWEIGKRKWVKGRNVGTAERFGYSEAFEEWGERDLADMVRQHRNHPSIILWSIGNEIDYPTDPYVHPESRVDPDFAGFSTGGMPSVTRLTVVAPRLIAAIKHEDPTRPVTMALANVPAANGSGLADMLDVAGYNYQEKEYAADHRNFPGRVIFGSENGRSPESWQVVKGRDYISGLFLWVGFDFLGEAGEWPNYGSTAGLFDRCGFLKTSALQFEAFWKPEPVARIVASPGTPSDRPRRRWRRSASHWTWDQQPGDPITVTVFSNCEEVDLNLNGRSLGAKPVDEQTASAQWTVPYESGELVAIGIKAGQEQTRDSLRTAGQPARLEAQPDKTSLQPGSVAHLVLKVTDKEGVPCPEFEAPVTVRVSGAGRLLGLDNGNQNDTTPLRSSTRVPRNGRLLALVQAGHFDGIITVKASADGLSPVVLSLKVEQH